MRDDDEDRQAPPTVVAAVGVGTVPIPFVAVYAVIFLVHGSVHPVVPPDVTDSEGGEFACGLVATALFVIASVSLGWALSGRRRWPFATVQTVLLGTAVYFLVNPTSGGTTVSVLLLVIALVALVLIFAPSAWAHFDTRVPPPLQSLVDRISRRPAAATGSASAVGGAPPGVDADAVRIGELPGGVRVVDRPRPPQMPQTTRRPLD